MTAAPPPPYYAPQPAPLGPGPLGYFDGAVSPADLDRPLYGATLGQAIKRFFLNYARFKGRASRSEYWWAQLFMTLVWILCGILVAIPNIIAETLAPDSYGISEEDAIEQYPPLMVVLIIATMVMVAALVALIVPSLSITWRRLHDANLAGPFYFLSLIYFVGAIVLFVLTLLPSKPEGRRFDIPRYPPFYTDPRAPQNPMPPRYAPPNAD